MLLPKKWVEKDGTRVIYRRNSLYINYIQKSLIFGVFAPKSALFANTSKIRRLVVKNNYIHEQA